MSPCLPKPFLDEGLWSPRFAVGETNCAESTRTQAEPNARRYWTGVRLEGVSADAQRTVVCLAFLATREMGCRAFTLWPLPVVLESGIGVAGVRLASVSL